MESLTANSPAMAEPPAPALPPASTPPKSSGSKSKQKVRIPKIRSSCDSCAKRKLRCDKEKPVCRRCRNQGMTCVFSPSLHYGKPKKKPRPDAAQQPAKGSYQPQSIAQSIEQKPPTTSESRPSTVSSPTTASSRGSITSYGSPLYSNTSVSGSHFGDTYSAKPQISDPFFVASPDTALPNMDDLPNFSAFLDSKSIDIAMRDDLLADNTFYNNTTASAFSDADWMDAAAPKFLQNNPAPANDTLDPFPGLSPAGVDLADIETTPPSMSTLLSYNTACEVSDNFYRLRHDSFDASSFDTSSFGSSSPSASSHTSPATHDSPDWSGSEASHSPSHHLHPASHNDCVPSARAALVKLHRLPQLGAAHHLASAADDAIRVQLDSILATTQDALKAVAALLACACVDTPLLQLYLQLVMAEVMTWHEAILKVGPGSGSSAASVVEEKQQLQQGKLPIMIGSFVVEGEFHDVFIRQIVSSQVQVLRGLLEQFGARCLEAGRA